MGGGTAAMVRDIGGSYQMEGIAASKHESEGLTEDILCMMVVKAQVVVY